MQTLENGITVPTNGDPYQLTTDMANAFEDVKTTVRVSSVAERDALTKYDGLTVIRLDVAGRPQETWDGAAWQGFAWASYTPSWGGWVNLGTGYTSTGSYMLKGKLCSVRMKLVGGTGGNLGTGALAVTLPFTSAPDQSTLGDAQWLQTGPAGLLQRVALSNPASNNQASILSWSGGNTTATTPGSAGFGFAAGTEIHGTLTYRIA